MNLSEIVDGSTNLVHQAELHEYNTFSFRGASDNQLTIPTGHTGWYTILFYIYHPSANLSGTSSQNGLGNFRTGIKTNTGAVEYGSPDSLNSTPEGTMVCIPAYLSEGEIVSFWTYGSTSTNEDFVIRISLKRDV